MKGIILAGGSGSRLYPITKGVSKQLLPVYDKPMVYYPLGASSSGHPRNPRDLDSGGTFRFSGVCWAMPDYGVRIDYAAQPSPDGLAQAFSYRRGFPRRRFRVPRSWRQHLLRFRLHGSSSRGRPHGRGGCLATVFGYRVDDPGRHGSRSSTMRATAFRSRRNPPIRSLTTQSWACTSIRTRSWMWLRASVLGPRGA